MEWQPIESAPKADSFDKRLLLYVPSDYGAEIGYRSVIGWVGVHGCEIKPSHWAPLPPPPANDNRKDGEEPATSELTRLSNRVYCQHEKATTQKRQ